MTENPLDFLKPSLFKDKSFLLLAASALCFLFSCALLLLKGPLGAAAVLLGVAFVWGGIRMPFTVTWLLFFLIPLTGFANNLTFKFQAIPLFWGPFWGWCVAMCFLEFQKESDTPVPSILNRLLLLLVISSIVPSAWAVIRYAVDVWPAWGAPVADKMPPWTRPLVLKQAIGWVIWGNLNFLGGLLFFYLCLKRSKVLLNMSLFLEPISYALVISVVMGVFQIAGSADLFNAQNFWLSQRISSTFADPNALALFVALLIPLLLGWWWGLGPEERSRFWSLPKILSLTAGLCVLILFSGTRSSLFSLGGGALLALLFLVIKKRKSCTPQLCFFVLAGFAALMIVVFFTYKRIPLLLRIVEMFQVLLGQGGEDASVFKVYGGRWEIWKRAWEVVQLRPFLGSGMGTYLIEIRRMAVEFALPNLNDNAGNLYLQIWAEGGLGAILGTLTIFGMTLLKSLKAVIAKGTPRTLFLLAPFSGVVLAFFFGSHILRFEVALIFWYLVALIWHEETA